MEDEEVAEDIPVNLGELREHVRSLEGSRPAEDLELLDLRADLAQLEIDDGDPARAVAQLEALVDSYITLEGPDSESALDFRGLLGRALTEARLYSEGESVLRRSPVTATIVWGLMTLRPSSPEGICSGQSVGAVAPKRHS